MSSSEFDKKRDKNVSAASVVCSDPNLVSTILSLLPKWEQRMSMRAVSSVWDYAADLYACWEEADLRWLDHSTELNSNATRQSDLLTKHVDLTPYRLTALRVLTVSNPPLGMKHLLQAFDKCKDARLESLTVFLRNNISKMIVYRANPSVVRLGAAATATGSNQGHSLQKNTSLDSGVIESGLNNIKTLHVEFPLSISDIKFLIGRTPNLKVLILTSLVPFYRFRKDSNTRRERLPTSQRMPEFINSWKHQEWMRRYLYAHLAKMCDAVNTNTIEAIQVDLFPMVPTRDFAQTLSKMTNCDICVGTDETEIIKPRKTGRIGGRDGASFQADALSERSQSYDLGSNSLSPLNNRNLDHDLPDASNDNDTYNTIIANANLVMQWRQDVDLSEEADQLISRIIACHGDSLKCLHSSDLYVSLEVMQRIRKECNSLASWTLPGWRLIFPQL